MKKTIILVAAMVAVQIGGAMASEATLERDDFALTAVGSVAESACPVSHPERAPDAVIPLTGISRVSRYDAYGDLSLAPTMLEVRPVPGLYTTHQTLWHHQEREGNQLGIVYASVPALLDNERPLRMVTVLVPREFQNNSLVLQAVSRVWEARAGERSLCLYIAKS